MAWMDDRVKASFKDLRVRKVFAGGMLGGIFATIIMYIGTGFLDFPFPPLVIFQTLIAPVPGSVQSVVVDTFQEYAKYSTFVASSAIYAVMYGFIAVFLAFVFKGELGSKAKQATIVGAVVPTVIGLGLQLNLTNAFPAISTLYGWVLSGLLILAANLIYAQILINYAKIPPPEAVKQPPIANLQSGRRGLLKKAAIATIVIVLIGTAAKLGISILSKQPVVTSGTAVPVNPTTQQTTTTSSASSGPPSVFSDPRISDLLASEVTDSRVFYRVDIDPIPPQLNFDRWQLNLHGKVNNPIILDKVSLLQMSTIDEYATLECVSNTIYPPGGLISNAKWTGVPLATLLNQAGLQSDSKYVVFTCADGYTVGIPIARALEPEAVLAYMMNGAPLPTEHGFPLRAIVPGFYGYMAAAKWITEMEVTDQVYLGYWQQRGWTNDARVKTTSIIYYPTPNMQVSGPTPIAGVAFAGDRGISKVEVSTDGGSTWDTAELKPPKSPFSWILWAYEWAPTTTGTQTIIARATDGKGQLQNPTVAPTFPDGASGYSKVQVTVGP